ncbi:MAG: 1-deoxy-D-xylulose-5-phosphate synthase [bacterium]|nr:1-deoxy-D-xylulose-5-phosphate synthase [bacterium]
MNNTFEGIDSPGLLKQLPQNELVDYASYLRHFLIEKIAEQGGHFAANLGVIELTIALHYIFNSPNDKMIWDVGHQAYAHKILTGRKEAFNHIRQLNGISGFPKMTESVHDAFGTGHSSTAISAALGYAVAAKIQDIERQNIAIIGDGALSAGQAFEGLNNAAISNTNITIVLNDNHIGIDPSQGALGEYLELLDFKKDNLFTDFGFQYFGPIDGHNLEELISVFKQVKTINSPKIIHVKTTKGKGYKPAEEEQTKWHSTSQFDKLSGKSLVVNSGLSKYQDIFGKHLLSLAERNDKIVAITPAMISGSSLHFMQQKFPDRVFDVGIAEQHAVTFSAGLAASGMRPFCCIYSTFLQRGYDQLIHDVALQNLPVIFAVDRAGLVGEDGPTHHGVFDISFLQTVPNLVIVSPRNENDLVRAMEMAIENVKSPTVIRYPRGHADLNVLPISFNPLPIGLAECLKEGHEICIISHGTIAKECTNAILHIDSEISVAHYDFKFIKPLDKLTLEKIFISFSKIIVVEEGQKLGGFGSTIALSATENNYKGQLKIMAIQDHFVTHGSMRKLFELEDISIDSIVNTIKVMHSK